ncbi:acylphosphatase [Bacillus sp. T3]|uniref:acylphosphatase n=1 Tax=Bacillus sp. T3 TaxID=467262 RepID=UPI0029814B18|nr:acylphosphatase [Bacillus sp. T3]
MKQIYVTVYGQVQGVGFRYFSQMKAIQYGIRGWVRNCEDGSVEIVAQGSDDNLHLFLEDVRRGNPFSTVDDLAVQEIEKIENYHSFKIKY